MKVFNPFGPVLAKVKIPKKIVNKINLEVDKIIFNKKLSKKNDYSKKVVGQVYQEIKLSDQFTSKVTKNKKNTKTNGTIDFISGQKSFLSNSIHNHVPKVGDMIIFPNYLMHTAYPFSVEGERRSFSFNLEVDKKISKTI